MKVQQFEGKNGGVKNQFLITDEGRGALGNFIKRETFQSYNSVIAVRTIWDKKDCEGFKTNNIDIELDEKYWDYSTTTGKYRNMFLGEGIEETRKKIKSGEYKLVNLNKGE